MHATTMWDVLLAGVLVGVGMGSQMSAREAGRNARWFRLLCWEIASLGGTCWGIGSVTFPTSSLWPFMLMAGVGSVGGSGVFEDIKIFSLFRPRRRG